MHTDPTNAARVRQEQTDAKTLTRSQNEYESITFEQCCEQVPNEAALARKEERAEKKAELEASAAAQLEAYNKCTPTCMCGLTPCPQAGFVLCTVCKDIKRSECRKAKCVAAKAPLMLTMALPAPVLTLPAPGQ